LVGYTSLDPFEFMTDSPQIPLSASTYFIRTFGSQMNVADSIDYARVLENLGCVRAASEESCDILVVNTCSVRAKAEEKAISYIGEVISKRPNRFESGSLVRGGGIALVGCMATVRGDEIHRRFPLVKLICPATQKQNFEELVLATWPELASVAVSDIVEPILHQSQRFERFVPIIRGCSNRCTYCIVPSARGGTIESRPPFEIYEEIDRLLGSGVKSITLLGQNVCAYGKDIHHDDTNLPSGWDKVPAGFGFAELLENIRDRFAREGVWFKFLTSHPRDVSERMVDTLASHGSFSRHFHLPLQAGDNEVLRRMARGYTSEHYRELVAMIRAKLPDMRLTTDLIVGFPGEDEPAFEHTLDMVRDIGFDAAFTFMYSPRAGTIAESWADPVPQDEKKRRLQKLIEIQNRITSERASRRVGCKMSVLINGYAMDNPSREHRLVAGRSREEEVVILPGGPDDFGKMIDVEITASRLRSFVGRRLE
jgi:tRNA-2-methylthio-N6-dimethylallyladenosine synthase